MEEKEGIPDIYFSLALFFLSSQPSLLWTPDTGGVQGSGGPHYPPLPDHGPPIKYHREPLFLLPLNTVLYLHFQPFHQVGPYQPSLCISLPSSEEWSYYAVGITPSQEVF